MKKAMALLMALFFLAFAVPLAQPQAEGATLTKPSATPRISKEKPSKKKSLAAWEAERKDVILTGDLRQDILIIARSQIGYSADASCFKIDKNGKYKFYTRYGDWYGRKFSDWCDMFVSFCVFYGGMEDYPFEQSCARHELKLKQAGYWREWNNYVPQPGDLVFFDLDEQRRTPNHVGVFEEILPAKGDKPAQMITIEGNVRNSNGRMSSVQRMTRSLKEIVGYGTYEKGTVYPEAYSVRSSGWDIIDEDSIYFVDRPTEEALRFLGMEGSRYYAYWFPEATSLAADPAGAEDPAAEGPTETEP